ncbi:MAG TPA: nicotinate-nucleotide--dimethylbenzimidazole phosphoribosyltransferase [Jatrophihabitans sp.]|nr:nicotinate-nucleotide--dimethylbenzimidazole phosphoribosyltransferase [Jatrophihabitans sp.]
MSASATDLEALGADVEWTDAEAAAAARVAAPAGGGRLAEFAEWLAGAQGRFPLTPPKRARCVVVGQSSTAVAAVADSLGVGIRTLAGPDGADGPDAVGAAVAAGIAAADDEIDSGADLVVLAVADSTAASAVVVGLLAGVEPVALLPRGADAIDTAAWITRAEHLRDARRRVAELRGQPTQLLAAADGAALATATGFLLRAVTRRTPMVLDGTCAVAAALVCHHIQPRAGRWWRVADVSSDPVHTRASEEMGQRPMLDLGITRGDGTAGLLALSVLLAAVTLAGPGQ